MTDPEKPAVETTVAPPRRMTIGQHLEELRWRVLRCVLYLGVALVICLVFNDSIVRFILAQPRKVLEEVGQTATFQTLDATEPFMTWLKIGFISAMLLSSPLIARELWGFVAAGLHPHERRHVQFFAPFSYLLFLGGVAFLYFVVLPTALKFLFTFGVQENLIEVKPQYASYISFYIVMSLIMGAVFQLPIVMLFFMAVRIIKRATFKKYRRHFIVGAIAVLAVVTPTGDAMTLLLVSLPVLLLYEAGIILGGIFVRENKV